MPPPMLVLSEISKVFNRGTQDQKTALDNISLTVNQGDFVTIIGSNGAGKTTLLNIIAGTHNPDTGRITICGDDITRRPEHRMAAYMARVFQNPTTGTAGKMTIEENLCMAELRGCKRRLFRWGVTRHRRQQYQAILKTLDLGLEHRLGEKVGLLSGGQRQSLSLLMTTLIPPKLLILDEHTAALDPKTAAKVMALTDHMIQQNRLTTLMVTHNMHQALRYGNRMIMLHRGRIKLDVSGAEKEQLTVKDVVQKFELSLDDETLLSTHI